MSVVVCLFFHLYVIPAHMLMIFVFSNSIVLFFFSTLQKFFLLISAVLAAAQADVSHLAAGNSLDGYHYPKPAIPFESQGYAYPKPEIAFNLPQQSSGYVYEKPRNPLVYPEQKPLIIPAPTTPRPLPTVRKPPN